VRPFPAARRALAAAATRPRFPLRMARARGPTAQRLILE
jgi:hypothetical protein